MASGPRDGLAVEPLRAGAKGVVFGIAPALRCAVGGECTGGARADGHLAPLRLLRDLRGPANPTARRADPDLARKVRPPAPQAPLGRETATATMAHRDRLPVTSRRDPGQTLQLLAK